MRRTAPLLILLLAAVPPALAQAPSPPVTTLPDGRRLAVVDGDSITVDGIEWRLQGFDTPEVANAGCEGERRLGLVATRRLAQILGAASPAAIVITDSGERDRHRRPLGDLVVAGVNVRDTLVQEGLARPYNGGLRKGWCSRDSRDDLVPGPPPARQTPRQGTGR